jgi:hypothetical protein
MARLTAGPGKRLGTTKKNQASSLAKREAASQLKKYKQSLKSQKLTEKQKLEQLQIQERGGKKGKMSVSPAVKVKAKRQDRFSYFTKDENVGLDKKREGKQFRAQVAKTKLPSDSMAYFSKLGEFNPRAAEGTRKSMAQIQQAYKERFPNATFTYGKGVSGEPLLTAQLNTPKKKMTAAQIAANERLKTQGKDPESVRRTLGLSKKK